MSIKLRHLTPFLIAGAAAGDRRRAHRLGVIRPGEVQ